MSEQKISLTKRRAYLVQMFYRYLLMNNDTNYIKQDILDEIQEKLDVETTLIANNIAEKLSDLKKEIKKHLSASWKWERIPTYVQSILVVGAYEIIFTPTPKAVSINELVKLVKENLPDFDYKFVNACLDKIIKI
ncbi:transcription antitermination protein NusB [Mesoplasma chauliocola]|uniref:Transcription antitermination protein NusB n=1 Tax=Mesoplasma chauliocola TaxID=216427 RepID=A0A249SNB7_9MOLU|nr:transcription antitermination protein NusB [Mesoplasma chauliocola]ASZ09097.1 transcription antitermination protein NusB [Mesoplasma chauliocola]